MDMKKATLVAMMGSSIYFTCIIWNVVKFSSNSAYVLTTNYYVNAICQLIFSLSLFIFLFAFYRNQR